MAPQMAFIGLGQMGKAMSRKLVEKAQLTSPLILYNRSPQVAKEHSADIGPSEPTESIIDAVLRSEIIWSCLAGEEAVSQVFDQICTVDIKGKVFVECSTMPPDATAAVAKKIETNGASFVAMPVFGEPATAAAGNLIVVPAGSAAAIDLIRPYLDGCLAGAVIDFSDKPQSQGQLLKIVGNVLIMTTIEQVAELMVLSEKTGLGADNLRKLFSALNPAGPLKLHQLYAGHMASGEWAERVPIVSLDMAIALTDKVSSMATSHGVQLKSYDVALAHLRDAKARSSGKADILSIYGAVRAEGGLKFKTE